MKPDIKINSKGWLEINGFIYTIICAGDGDCWAFVKKWIQPEFQIYCQVYRKKNRKWYYIITCTGIKPIKSKGYKTALQAINQCNKQINF